jgi:hypothetical protein
MSQVSVFDVINSNPTIPTSFLLDDANLAVPAANVVVVHGENGVETSLGASNEIVLSVVNNGMTWTDQSVTFNALAQNGYFCTGVLTVNLPAAPTQGNTIIIYVDDSSVVTVQANTGQTIQIGSGQSSVAGTASSTSEGSCLTLVYRSSDSEWHSIADNGSWTLA